ncbi:unnamed protein product [Lupinus luteus]|uniref:Uncharacterized protein n=1 Tax=Lupinus luteus TaxID=3873 RepID=A0AAV1W4N7_LUPLU
MTPAPNITPTAIPAFFAAFDFPEGSPCSSFALVMLTPPSYDSGSGEGAGGESTEVGVGAGAGEGSGGEVVGAGVGEGGKGDCGAGEGELRGELVEKVVLSERRKRREKKKVGNVEMCIV